MIYALGGQRGETAGYGSFGHAFLPERAAHPAVPWSLRSLQYAAFDAAVAPRRPNGTGERQRRLTSPVTPTRLDSFSRPESTPTRTATPAIEWASLVVLGRRSQTIRLDSVF
eukprot:scaffold1667_cov173-Amphora_coffeaeformis.AAC.31